MIIGITGKIGSGKDTFAKILQILTQNPHFSNEAVKDFLDRPLYPSLWEVHRFSDALKDIVCILIGCTREQLEDREFKEKELGEEWIRYSYATGFTEDNKGNKRMLTEECSKEKFEAEKAINWQTAYKVEFTPRMLLQFIGTNLFREQLINNIWVNALMNKYTLKFSPENYYLAESHEEAKKSVIEPLWIIPDVRFPNEAEAIKGKDGILIRIERPASPFLNSNHISEIALDNYKTSWTITNTTIDELINTTRQIINYFNLPQLNVNKNGI